MQKKLELELTSLAHSILKLKKGDDINILKEKAYQVYEKLTVLSFIETFVKESPQNTKTIEELVTETFVESAEKENDVISENEVAEIPTVSEEKEIQVDQEVKNTALKIDEIEVDLEETQDEKEVVDDLFSRVEIEESIENNIQSSFEKEFESTVSLDVATDIFEKAERISLKKSINDAIMQQKNLQIDLNDRIAFVKNLFNNSQEDFNRVISQLNTMTSEKEALSLLKMIKKEYNWDGKEIYEERLLLLIERKFN